jgi:hypothetical protein
MNNIAKKILEQTSIPEEEKFGNVIALLMIISLCFTAIRIIQECKNSRASSEDTYVDMQKFCRQKTLAKWRLHREMRKIMSKDQYAKYKNELTNAILNTASQMSFSEIKPLLEDLNA